MSYTNLQPHDRMSAGAWAAITAALDAGVPPREVQKFARHKQLNTTMWYDRNLNNLDSHAAYTVTAFISGSSY